MVAFRPSSGIDDVFYQNYLLEQNNAIRAAQMQAYNSALQAQWSRTARLNTVIDRMADQGVFYLTSVSVQGLINGAISASSGAAQEDLAKFGKLAVQLQRQRRGQWQRTFDLIGQEATKATVASYLKSKNPNSQPYRANASGKMKRYAGGALEDALNSSQMWLARPDGIAFVNVSWLDSRAKQWARLNFGVAPRGDMSNKQITSGRPNVKGQSFDVRFYRQATESSAVKALTTGMRFGFSSIGARPPMMIPSGLWLTDGKIGQSPSKSRKGLDQFWPAARSQRGRILGSGRFGRNYGFQDRKISQGVSAMGFLNAGASVIAYESPRAIAALVMDGLATAHKGSGGKVAFDVGIPAAEGRAIARAFSQNINSVLTRKMQQTNLIGTNRTLL